MYVKKNGCKNGRILLTFTEGFRVNGAVKQKNIETLGYLDDLAKIHADPIAYFKAEAKRRNEEKKGLQQPILLKFDRQEGIDAMGIQRKNLGYVALQKVYYALELDAFFKKKQRTLNVAYRLNDVARLLIFSRILEPASKRSTYENKAFFFEAFDFSLPDLYRSLDTLNHYKEELQTHLHQVLRSTLGRDSSIAYYDCTNYYFEISYNDADIVDEHGVLLHSGLRKKGPSKEHRPEPIVQMGLLMDSHGIPMAYDLFPGNQSEKTSLRPILSRAKRDFDLAKTIVVADRGLNTSDNIFFHQSEYDGYVFAQSIRGADQEMKAQVLRPNDYQMIGDGFKLKSRIVTKEVTILRDQKRKQKTTVIQKQVFFYSPDYAARSHHERALVIQKAQDLMAHPGKYTRATSVGAAGYVKNILFDEQTGEVKASVLSLDWDKIHDEARYDGYYAIVTSEVEKSDAEILEIYRGLWRIEESFKIIKSEFKARPVYVSLEAHIQAHFLTCFIALVILRILQLQLDHPYSPNQIIHSLTQYACSHMQENYYLFDYRDNVIVAVEKAYQLNLGRKVLSQAEIKNILSNSKK